MLYSDTPKLITSFRPRKPRHLSVYAILGTVLTKTNMAEPTEKVETTAETEGATTETVAEEKAEGTTEEVQKEPEAIDPEKYTPEVRERPWTNREERKEFFTAKQKETTKEEEPAVMDDVDISALVQKKIDAAINPLQQRLAEEADDREVRSFLSKPENQRFAKYEALARKEMKVYANVPIAKLFRSLAFEDAEKLGADKATQVADKQTRRSVTGTTTRKAASGLPDFRSMSPAQVEEFNRRVARGEKFSE